MYCYKNDPVESPTMRKRKRTRTRTRSMPKLAWSSVDQSLERGEGGERWRLVAGRDAESMLRSAALREADPFGLADLPPVVR